MSDSAEKVNVNFMNKVATFDHNDPGIVYDRVLLVDEKKFYVQSGLLAVWSEYFHGLFNSDFKEKNEIEIELKEVSADEFNVFLQVIYPGFFEIQASQIESLIELSHRFLVPNVLEMCKKFIEKDFDQMDKIILHRAAAKFEMEELKEKTMNWIAKNVESLDFIELLKLAFDYDLKSVKKSLRSFIYTTKKENKWFYCSECPDNVKEKRCEHSGERPPITRNSLIAKYINEISEMPLVIQNFVLKSSVSYI